MGPWSQAGEWWGGAIGGNAEKAAAMRTWGRARAIRRERATAACRRGPLQSGRSGDGEGVVDRAEQRLLVDRLAEIVRAVHARQVFIRQHVVVGGDEDDGYAPTGRSQTLLHLEPAHS